ncbi:MAG: 50S ribosomal protein L16 [Candidatus Nanoarchaeia archaeon]
MAKLRQASAYRKIKRPYVRISKVKSKAYIKGVPHIKVSQYDIGDGLKYPIEVQLISCGEVQIRDNALEAARQVIVRKMESVSKTGWSGKVRVVPHHVLRLNPLATGAGADRFQRGMSLSFGRPEGHAAQVKTGKVLFSLYVPKEKVELAKLALKKANAKLPVSCKVKVVENKE